MKINFEYNKEKDVWCLLSKGKSSNNSTLPTEAYKQLVASYGDSPTGENTSDFIEKYISENNIDVQELITTYQKDWETIADEFHKRAEGIFGTDLPKNVTAYLTINNRCPYDIENNFFFVSMTNHKPVRMTIMHELWHFYTWYSLGVDEEAKLGKQRYNDLKEALTVLINTECKDLLSEGIEDTGYSQHKELREKILEFWSKDKNIANLWKYLTA